MSQLSHADAAQLLYREALLLDSLDLEAWLELFTKDCVFWMPAWRDDGTQTDDPDAELSLIYYRGRRNLADRIQRIRSGFSVASAVMPRVSHMIGNVIAEPVGDGLARVNSTFIVNVHDVRSNRSHAYFGRYEHELRNEDGAWKIARKVIRLLNDRVPTMLDVYGI
ncbi:3-phenylpropionate/cinnamic acid dioxygenase small subunit [Sphingobium sp. B11D3B]|uniref:aromatic-ring-hydroxylating dioxygenase subunit beta n=1 Tax=Sphingobium sp. B11D3B TaxID=2940575 RepID=UPI0022277123|nr:aromatic-ring-hydroxylating dioxygenase subunit beta [Sphingobium sp. B11D3B]MCW2388033.1 3-phenylpropionate/cinnamic acid dioxygenase small subunit [Sphingobium sp. B11D3B]